jgi:hypothetical protein
VVNTREDERESLKPEVKDGIYGAEKISGKQIYILHGALTDKSEVDIGKE